MAAWPEKPQARFGVIHAFPLLLLPFPLLLSPWKSISEGGGRGRSAHYRTATTSHRLAAIVGSAGRLFNMVPTQRRQSDASKSELRGKFHTAEGWREGERGCRIEGTDSVRPLFAMSRSSRRFGSRVVQSRGSVRSAHLERENRKGRDAHTDAGRTPASHNLRENDPRDRSIS